MTAMLRPLALALALVGLAAGTSVAGDITKEACVDAHSRGQDAREQGKLSLARKLFFTCAQAGCPAAVQADCAQFVDDLNSLQPTIVFIARDGDGNDLPATSVYVDGILVVAQLDGKPQDIDPGKHSVRFVHGGRDEILTVVIGSGEKGRTLQARFGSPKVARPAVAQPTTPTRPSPAKRSATRTTHPGGSLALAVTGGIVTAGGIALAMYGISKVPESCSLATNECSATPGDPVFDQAQDGAHTMNIGIVVSGVGAAVLVGGVVWYLAGAKTTHESATQIAPVLRSDGGGLAISGRF